MKIINPSSPFSYFYLYRLSYLYSVVIGFTVTFLVGYAASQLLALMRYEKLCDPTSDDNKVQMNFELYFPPIAKALKKKQSKLVRRLSKVSMERSKR